jgi:hypothetical protein
MKQVIDWAKAHPRLTAWLVLGLGMNAIVVFEARTVGLLAGQWAALLVATTLVAGLCVWIIGWEDDPTDEAPDSGTEKAASQPAEPKK